MSFAMDPGTPAPFESGPPRPRVSPRPTTRHETDRPVAPRVASPPDAPASQRVKPRGGPPSPRGVRQGRPS